MNWKQTLAHWWRCYWIGLLCGACFMAGVFFHHWANKRPDRMVYGFEGSPRCAFYIGNPVDKSHTYDSIEVRRTPEGTSNAPVDRVTFFVQHGPECKR